jgi:hypothetical protein
MIHVIHTSDRVDRYELLQKEVHTHALKINLWQGERATPVSKGVALSHKKIVQWALDTGLPEVCIAENDFHLVGTGAWEHFLSQKPAEYDLYLASMYVKWPVGDTSDVKDFRGMTLYFVHSRFYSRFLSVPDQGHIDFQLSRLTDRKYVVCYPFAAIQHETYSDNAKTTHRNQDYLADKLLYDPFIQTQ